MSQGGAAYFCGKGVDNKDQKASIMGAVAGAHYIRSVAPAYEIPVILHTDHCAKKLLPWLEGMLKVYDHANTRPKRMANVGFRSTMRSITECTKNLFSAPTWLIFPKSR